MANGRIRLAIAGAATAILFSFSHASAQWVPDGILVDVHPADHSAPIAIADGAGGALIAWVTDPQDDIKAHLFLQRITAEGTVSPGWPPRGVPIDTVGSVLIFGWLCGDILTWPVLASDGAGGAFVAWWEKYPNATRGIRVQHVLGSSAIAPGWPRGNGIAPAAGSSPSGWCPVIVSDGAGGAIVAWDQVCGSGINAQRLDAAGTRLWGSAGVLLCGAPGDQQLGLNNMVMPDENIVSDGASGAFLTWKDPRSDAMGDLYAQHVLASGEIAPGWPADGVRLCGAAGEQCNPALVSDGAGGIIAAWTDRRSGAAPDSNADIYAQHVTSDGTISGGWPADGLGLCTARQNQFRVVLSPDGAGGALAAWVDQRAKTDPEDFVAHIYAQHVTGLGTLAAGWPADGVAMCSAPFIRDEPALAADGSGGAYLAWEDMRDRLNSYLYATHFTGDGLLAPGWRTDGDPLCLAADACHLQAVSDGAGGAVVAWRDFRNAPPRSTTGAQIFAQRLVTDGEVPVKLSLVSADASPERVRLVWFVSRGMGTSGAVYRSRGGDWSVRGPASTDGTGRLTFEDRDVTPGARYGYRVELGPGVFAGETWVDVPRVASFALAGARPNPAAGRLSVAFSLPDASPARLELLDLAGRRILARDVGALGPGSHIVSLGEGLALPAGAYLLRLTQGSRSFTARAVVVR